jgi:hypothetical protein
MEPPHTQYGIVQRRSRNHVFINPALMRGEFVPGDEVMMLLFVIVSLRGVVLIRLWSQEVMDGHQGGIGFKKLGGHGAP